MSMEIIAAVIVTFTVACVYFLARVETKWVQTILNWFPAILFAYAIPAIFTHAFSLELSGVFLHTLSRDWIIPITILTVMSALPFAQLKIVGIKPIIVFVGGSFVIALLPVILVGLFGILDPASKVMFMGQDYWKGLVPIVGGWIGGSTSQLVLKELAGTDEALFLSILVLDNTLVNIWTILMFQFIKRSDGINSFFKITNQIKLIDKVDDGVDAVMKSWQLVAIVVGIAAAVSLSIDSFLWRVVLLSVIGLLLGNLVKTWDTKLVLKIGGILIIVIMAILGLKLDFTKMSLPLILVLLVVVWLVLHFIAMILIAVALRVNIAWVPIGSMANLGGISTAPAVTAAYRKELMPHAILLAILSMVSGTAWGMLTIYLFEHFLV